MWLRRKRKTQNVPPGPQLTHGLQGIQGHTSSKAKTNKQTKKKNRESRANFQYLSDIAECGF